MPYTIIIPIHNEDANIPALLEGLKPYSKNNEILIIDDGSNDGSFLLLKQCSYIRLVRLKSNMGKGAAIRKGMEEATYDKIVISDGDMELDPKEINRLMILDKENGLNCIFGSRYETINPFTSLWEFGNFFFTGLFNMVHHSNCLDALCCAKSFYRNELFLENISATGFDIDVELAGKLIKSLDKVHTVNLSYTRRSKEGGKKLRILDGWSILKQIFSNL